MRFYDFDIADPYERIYSRPHIAICPQDKENIFDHFTIAENIELLKSFKKDCFSNEVIDQLLDKLDLRQAAKKTFQQLSGGM